jgi:hypothetical protein
MAEHAHAGHALRAYVFNTGTRHKAHHRAMCRPLLPLTCVMAGSDSMPHNGNRNGLWPFS